jgi:hypothetical protein
MITVAAPGGGTFAYDLRGNVQSALTAERREEGMKMDAAVLTRLMRCIRHNPRCAHLPRCEGGFSSTNEALDWFVTYWPGVYDYVPHAVCTIAAAAETGGGVV